MDESQPATDQETTTADLPAAANQTATFKIGDRVGISTAAGRPCTDGTGYFAGTIIRKATKGLAHPLTHSALPR